MRSHLIVAGLAAALVTTKHQDSAMALPAWRQATSDGEFPVHSDGVELAEFAQTSR
jgi:hypothetical protein